MGCSTLLIWFGAGKLSDGPAGERRFKDPTLNTLLRAADTERAEV